MACQCRVAFLTTNGRPDLTRWPDSSAIQWCTIPLEHLRQCPTILFCPMFADHRCNPIGNTSSIHTWNRFFQTYHDANLLQKRPRRQFVAPRNCLDIWNTIYFQLILQKMQKYEKRKTCVDHEGNRISEGKQILVFWISCHVKLKKILNWIRFKGKVFW